MITTQTDPGASVFPSWGLPAEWLAGTEEEFVNAAYRRILGREPDPEGRGNWVGELRSGATRIEVLAGLARSREGHSRVHEAPETLRRVLAAESAESFVLWPVASSLPALLAMGDAVFVRCAYLTILGRPADEGGLAHHVRRLREGESKGWLLAGLRASGEGRAREVLLDEIAAGTALPPRIEELLALPGETFAGHASLLVLGIRNSSASSPPLLSAEGRETRLRTLRELASTARARELRALLSGIDALARRERLARLPVLGPLLALITGWEREGDAARARRRTENLLWIASEERMAASATALAAEPREGDIEASSREASREPGVAFVPSRAFESLRTLPPLASRGGPGPAGAGR